MKCWFYLSVLFCFTANAHPVLNFKSKTSSGILSLDLDRKTNTPVQISKTEDFWQGDALKNPNLKYFDPSVRLSGEKRLQAKDFVLQIYNPNTYSDYRFYADVVLEKSDVDYKGKIYLDFPSSNIYSAESKPVSLNLILDSSGNAYALYDNKFVDSMELITEELVSEIKFKGLVLNLREDISVGRREQYLQTKETIQIFK